MKRLLTIFLCFTLFGCVKDDHFGKSTRAEIKTFTLPGQSGNTSINREEALIVVPISENTVDYNLAPTEITISNFASISPSASEVRDFSDTLEYTVTAEDGSSKTYKVIAERTGSQPQLDNSSFEDWYEETVLLTSVEQPGLDAQTTIWGTANRGLALGGANANTTRQMIGDSSYVKLESVEAPALVRIAAATIFTGSFTSDFPSVSDPRSNIDLGIPFTARPLSFSFQFKYSPGPSNEDADGQPLAYGDMCDVYLLLENREDGETKRIGTAWFRNGEKMSEWTWQNVEIKYGALDPGDPWFDYAQPLAGESWGEPSDPITHISVLATSSFEGDFFNGAIGSVLELDNVVLHY